MESTIPEKAELLERLKKGNFDVPDFIYVPAIDFKKENFTALKSFFSNSDKSYKVIARSAHPKEKYFKGGTFDSLETYADIDGIIFARNRIIKAPKSTKRLSVLRQKKYNDAPDIDPDEMGIIVMPYIEGTKVMAKMIGDHWEFGYCHDKTHKVNLEPYITNTPHDVALLQLSEDIQKLLGFKCEIEYIISEDKNIHIVQAKDISHIEMLEIKESERSIKLEGIRRFRKRRNYRERPIFVMDNDALYTNIANKYKAMINEGKGQKHAVEHIISLITSYETELEDFALRHQRYGVLGLSIHLPEERYRFVNHSLDELPELQKQLSTTLHDNLYQIDYFLSESDTLIAKDKVNINMCTHDAYGINNIRYPLWTVYWRIKRNDLIVRKFKRLGFKTGDLIGIDIDSEDKPTVYRL